MGENYKLAVAAASFETSCTAHTQVNLKFFASDIPTVSKFSYYPYDNTIAVCLVALNLRTFGSDLLTLLLLRVFGFVTEKRGDRQLNQKKKKKNYNPVH